MEVGSPLHPVAFHKFHFYLFKDECFCGNSLVNGPTIADEADCNVGCAGNTTYVLETIRFICLFRSNILHIVRLVVVPIGFRFILPLR